VTEPPTATTSDPDPEPTPSPTRGITYNQLRASLLSAQLAIVNYCIRHAYSLQRWRNVVNVMILKEPGNFKIHRLRVLHLFEADHSVIQGNKSRDLIHHGVDNNLLHPEQHGGVPGRDSLTVPFIEQMLWDITRASRQPIIRTDFDATSCFDRIIPSIASLACRSFGQHCRICSLQAHALQGTNYQLKTPLGITEQGYSHCARHPIYGTGQGSSNSPSIWTCFSSILLKAHDACGHSALFRSPDGHFTAETNLQAFVDDTYLTSNGEMGDPCEAIVAKAQVAAQDWCDLLRATGGDLEPTKSSSYLVTFGFTMTGAPVLKRFPQECQLRVQDADGVFGDPIKSVSPLQSSPVHPRLLQVSVR
jgi:Reverse transcriptase (RNA-dependent DNA polymerase)